MSDIDINGKNLINFSQLKKTYENIDSRLSGTENMFENFDIEKVEYVVNSLDKIATTIGGETLIANEMVIVKTGTSDLEAGLWKYIGSTGLETNFSKNSNFTNKFFIVSKGNEKGNIYYSISPDKSTILFRQLKNFNPFLKNGEGIGSIYLRSISEPSTTATGDYSFAIGDQTEARGTYSHAEGYGTLAEGKYSHAEGNNAQANGESSHAEGRSTYANGAYSHAEGQYNAYEKYDKNGDRIEGIEGTMLRPDAAETKSGTSLLTIGCGASNTPKGRKNALEVWADGQVHIGDQFLKGAKLFPTILVDENSLGNLNDFVGNNKEAIILTKSKNISEKYLQFFYENPDGRPTLTLMNSHITFEPKDLTQPIKVSGLLSSIIEGKYSKNTRILFKDSSSTEAKLIKLQNGDDIGTQLDILSNIDYLPSQSDSWPETTLNRANSYPVVIKVEAQTPPASEAYCLGDIFINV